MGDMADMYDYALWPEDFASEPQEVTCKFCGKKKLYWDDSTGRWLLVDSDGDRHVCDQRRVRARVLNDFDIVKD